MSMGANSFQHHDKRISIRVENLIPNTHIVYFAAKKARIDGHLPSHVLAYKGFDNAGVASVDGNGVAVIRLDCPRIYRNEDGNVYPRHFHFKYFGTDNERLHTRHVFWPITMAEFKRKRNHYVVLDAGELNADKLKHIDLLAPIAIVGTKKASDKLKYSLDKQGYVNTWRLMVDA